MDDKLSRESNKEWDCTTCDLSFASSASLFDHRLTWEHCVKQHLNSVSAPPASTAVTMTTISSLNKPDPKQSINSVSKPPASNSDRKRSPSHWSSSSSHRSPSHAQHGSVNSAHKAGTFHGDPSTSVSHHHSMNHGHAVPPMPVDRFHHPPYSCPNYSHNVSDYKSNQCATPSVSKSRGMSVGSITPTKSRKNVSHDGHQNWSHDKHTNSNNTSSSFPFKNRLANSVPQKPSNSDQAASSSSKPNDERNKKDITSKYKRKHKEFHVPESPTLLPPLKSQKVDNRCPGGVGVRPSVIQALASCDSDHSLKPDFCNVSLPPQTFLRIELNNSSVNDITKHSHANTPTTLPPSNKLVCRDLSTAGTTSLLSSKHCTEALVEGLAHSTTLVSPVSSSSLKDSFGSKVITSHLPHLDLISSVIKGEASTDIMTKPESFLSTPKSSAFVSTPKPGVLVSTPIPSTNVSSPKLGSRVSISKSDAFVSIPKSDALVSIPKPGALVSTPIPGALVYDPKSSALESTPKSGALESTLLTVFKASPRITAESQCKYRNVVSFLTAICSLPDKPLDKPLDKPAHTVTSPRAKSLASSSAYLHGVVVEKDTLLKEGRPSTLTCPYSSPVSVSQSKPTLSKILTPPSKPKLLNKPQRRTSKSKMGKSADNSKTSVRSPLKTVTTKKASDLCKIKSSLINTLTSNVVNWIASKESSLYSPDKISPLSLLPDIPLVGHEHVDLSSVSCSSLTPPLQLCISGDVHGPSTCAEMLSLSVSGSDPSNKAVIACSMSQEALSASSQAERHRSSSPSLVTHSVHSLVESTLQDLTRKTFSENSAQRACSRSPEPALHLDPAKQALANSTDQRSNHELLPVLSNLLSPESILNLTRIPIAVSCGSGYSPCNSNFPSSPASSTALNGVPLFNASSQQIGVKIKSEALSGSVIRDTCTAMVSTCPLATSPSASIRLSTSVRTSSQCGVSMKCEPVAFKDGQVTTPFFQSSIHSTHPPPDITAVSTSTSKPLLFGDVRHVKSEPLISSTGAVDDFRTGLSVRTPAALSEDGTDTSPCVDNDGRNSKSNLKRKASSFSQSEKFSSIHTPPLSKQIKQSSAKHVLITSQGRSENLEPGKLKHKLYQKSGDSTINSGSTGIAQGGCVPNKQGLPSKKKNCPDDLIIDSSVSTSGNTSLETGCREGTDNSKDDKGKQRSHNDSRREGSYTEDNRRGMNNMSLKDIGAASNDVSQQSNGGAERPVVESSLLSPVFASEIKSLNVEERKTHLELSEAQSKFSEQKSVEEDCQKKYESLRHELETDHKTYEEFKMKLQELLSKKQSVLSSSMSTQSMEMLNKFNDEEQEVQQDFLNAGYAIAEKEKCVKQFSDDLKEVSCRKTQLSVQIQELTQAYQHIVAKKNHLILQPPQSILTSSTTSAAGQRDVTSSHSITSTPTSPPYNMADSSTVTKSQMNIQLEFSRSSVLTVSTSTPGDKPCPAGVCMVAAGNGPIPTSTLAVEERALGRSNDTPDPSISSAHEETRMECLSQVRNSQDSSSTTAGDVVAIDNLRSTREADPECPIALTDNDESKQNELGGHHTELRCSGNASEDDPSSIGESDLENARDSSHTVTSTSAPQAAHTAACTSAQDSAHTVTGTSVQDSAHTAACTSAQDSAHTVTGTSIQDFTHTVTGTSVQDSAHTVTGTSVQDSAHTVTGTSVQDSAHTVTCTSVQDSAHTVPEGDNNETSLPELMSHTKSVLCLKAFDDHVFSCSSDRSIHIYEANTGKLVKELSSYHQKSINCLTMYKCEGGVYLLSGSSDKCINMYSMKKLKKVTTFKIGEQVMAMDVSGDLLFVGLKTGSVLVVNIALDVKNKGLGKNACHNFNISCLSVDGDYLYTGSFDNTVVVWDIKESISNGLNNTPFKCIKSLPLPNTPLNIKVYDGHLFVACGDSNVYVYDVENWAQMYKLVHSEAVSALEIIGNVLVTSSFDKCVRCYDIKTMNMLAYAGYQERIFCLCAANSKIIAGMEDGSIKAVNMDLTKFFTCKWRDCGLRFAILDHLTNYHLKDHIDLKLDVATPCGWGICSELVQPSDLLTHLKQHCQDLLFTIH